MELREPFSFDPRPLIFCPSSGMRHHMGSPVGLLTPGTSMSHTELILHPHHHQPASTWLFPFWARDTPIHPPVHTSSLRVMHCSFFITHQTPRFPSFPALTSDPTSKQPDAPWVGLHFWPGFFHSLCMTGLFSLTAPLQPILHLKATGSSQLAHLTSLSPGILQCPSNIGWTLGGLFPGPPCFFFLGILLFF